MCKLIVATNARKEVKAMGRESQWSMGAVKLRGIELKVSALRV